MSAYPIKNTMVVNYSSQTNTSRSARNAWLGWAMLLISAAVLGGCANKGGARSGFFEPYKFDIQQGNYITADAVKQLKPGMNPEQVKNIMGSPLVVDAFRADRWDYLFHYTQANGKSETRRAAIFFDKGLLTRVEASELPASEAADDPVLKRGRVN
jgi:outer membrane protein assembly factor BamE